MPNAVTDAYVKDMHARAGMAFEALYREDGDPRWLREAHFHELASGRTDRLRRFGVAYKGELFAAGETWFKLRQYSDALEAFSWSVQLGLNNYHARLRVASCRIRAGERSQGEQEYADLLVAYPNALGAKMSYIDSLLYVRDFGGALAKLLEFELDFSENAWIAGQFGRAYMGLRRYQDAVGAFEMQVEMRPDPFAFKALSRAYHRSGNIDLLGKTLREATQQFPEDRVLRLSWAAFLIQSGQVDDFREAEEILQELLQERPRDGRALQQLVKLMRIEDRIHDAERLMAEINWQVVPEDYALPISIEIHVGKREWREALAQFERIPARDELVGFRKTVYLLWARSSTDPNIRKDIAKRGLEVTLDQSLLNNMPIAVTSARLARLAEDHDARRRYIEAVARSNEGLAHLLESEEYDSAWETEQMAL